MSDNACGCCGPAEGESTDRTEPVDRWIGDRPLADATLPADLARAATRLYTTESVETLGDFVEATRAEAGGSIAVADLCHADGETDHVARSGDDTYHFRCFYDGVALAHLVDEAVEIRTKSPSGTSIELRATPDGAGTVTPPDAVMSLGIAADVTVGADVAPPVEAVYEHVCPYVKAFPSRERYEGWAAAVDGATVGLPLAAGPSVAAALTE